MNLVDFKVIYKSITKRDGGEFTNDKGEVVKYEPSYVVKFDENVKGEIIERRLKFPITNKDLFNKINELPSYAEICLVCEVQLFTGNAKVTPVDIK